MVLESHSLKTAIARFQLTSTDVLRDSYTREEADRALRQIDVIREVVDVINSSDRADFLALDRLLGPAEEIQTGSADSVESPEPAEAEIELPTAHGSTPPSE